MKAKLEACPRFRAWKLRERATSMCFSSVRSLLALFAREKPIQPAEPMPLTDRPKKMVEHTSINPNKAAHIGHVRNAVLATRS